VILPTRINTPSRKKVVSQSKDCKPSQIEVLLTSFSQTIEITPKAIQIAPARYKKPVSMKEEKARVKIKVNRIIVGTQDFTFSTGRRHILSLCLLKTRYKTKPEARAPNSTAKNMLGLPL
jgi:hypothetical protein